MPKVLLLQLVMIAAVVAAAAFGFGARSAWSVAFGCFSVLIPHLLFVLYLKRAMRLGDRRRTVVTMLTGEFIKVMVSIGMMLAAYRFYPISWPWLIGGLVVGTKANLIAHLLKN